MGNQDLPRGKSFPLLRGEWANTTENLSKRATKFQDTDYQSLPPKASGITQNRLFPVSNQGRTGKGITPILVTKPSNVDPLTPPPKPQNRTDASTPRQQETSHPKPSIPVTPHHSAPNPHIHGIWLQSRLNAADFTNKLATHQTPLPPIRNHNHLSPHPWQIGLSTNPSLKYVGDRLCRTLLFLSSIQT